MKSRKQIPEEKKSKILAELFTPGCVVSQLAKSYEVSESVLYKWRRVGDFGSTCASSTLIPESTFIELSVNQIRKSKPANLQKISLTFRDCVISIDGAFSSAKLISIIEMLEESC